MNLFRAATSREMATFKIFLASALCSAHFEPSSFEQRLDHNLGEGKFAQKDF